MATQIGMHGGKWPRLFVRGLSGKYGEYREFRWEAEEPSHKWWIDIYEITFQPRSLCLTIMGLLKREPDDPSIEEMTIEAFRDYPFMQESIREAFCQIWAERVLNEPGT